jgi:DNA adenine methylase
VIGGLKAPMVWFGGKSKVADEVWRRFGSVNTYIEPFAGSLAVLLANPKPCKLEIVNDKDCYIANLFRALKTDPDGVAEHADHPVIHAELIARHKWLMEQQDKLKEKIMGDLSYCDVKIAGNWVWGINNWIGKGWCTDAGASWDQVPRLCKGHVGTMKVSMQCPHIRDQGLYTVSRKRPHISATGRGMNASGRRDGLADYLRELSNRLSRTRILCGDWSRSCTDFCLREAPPVAVFLDPPYSKKANRDSKIYSVEDLEVANAARDWAIAHAYDVRICLCGYEGEHEMPENWSVYAWETQGGFAVRSDKQGMKNKKRERLWFSPACNNGGFESLI